MPKLMPGVDNVKCFDLFTLRTPLFPVNFYKSLKNYTSKEDKDIIELFDLPIINTAIKHASPELFKQLEQLKIGNVKSPKKINKLKYSFYKYLVRMSTRSTPFGLFAGFSSGNVGKITKVLYDSETSNKVYLRYSIEELYKNSMDVLGSNKDNPIVKWTPNTTLYDFGSYWRYLERNLNDKKFEYSLEAVLKNKFVDHLIMTSENGRTYNELIEEMLGLSVTKEDSKSFIDNAIDCQLLVSNLEPNLTGIDFSNLLIKLPHVKMFEHNGVESIINSKNTLEEYCLNKKKENNEIPLHIDLIKEGEIVQFNRDWIPKLKNLFNFFNHITPHKPNARINFFKKEFTKKFGTSKVPLSKVLDPETGIDYLNSNSFFGEKSFLDDLVPTSARTNQEHLILWRKYEVFLNKKLEDAIRSNVKIITLKYNDFDGIENNSFDLPPTMFSLINVYNDNGLERLFVESFNGSSAANMIARLGYVDENFQKTIHEIIAFEKRKYPDKIIAEIVHTPSLKVSKILRRPILRNYEIPYLGRSTLDNNMQLLINDLVVTVVNNKVLLESKKFEKEIIPVLTCTHNYSKSPIPIYQFLSDIGFSDNNKIGFSWGSLAGLHHIFPRVEFENIIISKAKWILNKSDMLPLLKTKIILKTVQNWREVYGIPQFVLLTNNDNFLVIDFEDLFSVEVLIDEISGEKWIELEEFLFEESSPVVNEKGEYYSNEFLINWKIE